jgi:hypothetical protein
LVFFFKKISIEADCIPFTVFPRMNLTVQFFVLFGCSADISARSKKII